MEKLRLNSRKTFRGQKRHRTDGSITVFLTLIFLLIISLIGTCIQIASVHSLEAYMDGYGDTALEAVFTNYQKELWQDYGLFLLEEGSLDAGGIAEEVESYLQTDLMDNKNLLLTEVAEEQVVRLSDYPEKILLNQILELMKYQEVDTLYKKFTGQAEKLEESAEIAKVAAEEMKKNKAASSGQAVILELMQLLDGIVIKNGNIKYDVFGNIKYNSHCAKNLISLAEDKQSMGISEEIVWQAVKDNGCLTKEHFETIEKAFHILLPESGKQPKKTVEKKEKKEMKKAVQEILKSADISLAAMKQAAGKLEQWKPEGDTDAVKQKQNLSQALQKNIGILEELLLWEVDTSTEKGLSAFRQMYEQGKESIQQYGFQGTAFSYEYVLAEKSKKNPLELLKVLLHNGILDLVTEDATKLSTKTVTIEETTEESKGKTPTAKDSVTNASGEKVKMEQQQEVENQEVDLCEGILKSRIDETDDSLIEQLDSAGDGLSTLTETGEDLTQKFMVTEYIFRYFSNYTEKPEKDTALDYEAEYLLYGKTADKENLGAVASKIAGIRTILAFAALLSDQEKSAQVELTAIALLGFTGIPALVKAAQYLILLCWAYEEALIDTAALLEGEELPLLKSSQELLLSYDELFLFSKALVQKKVKQISKVDHKSPLTFSYQDYLRLFLMMEKEEKLYGRIMHLMQKNMRLRYDASYSLEDSVFAAGVRVSYKIPAVFISLPFVNRLLDSDIREFTREKIYAHSY